MSTRAPGGALDDRPVTGGNAAASTVLHVRSSGGIFGADRVVLDLCSGLGDADFQPVLVPLVECDGSGEDLARAGRAAGIEVRPLTLGGAFDPTLWRGLADIARQTDAAILHGHDYKSDVAVACARGDWARVSTVHGWVGTSLALRVKEAIDARLVRRFDAVICVSEALRRREGIDDATVVHNGIDLSPFVTDRDGAREGRVRSELGVPPALPVVGAIGRLSEEKGYDVLLDAVALNVEQGLDCAVLLVGDGPAGAALAARAGELGIAGRLHMPGLRHDAPRIYPVFDVFCMPSHREGLPLALLEALASACAVVATPVGGIPEVVGEGDAVAAQVPPNDAAALAVTLAALLGDAARRRRLGDAGRARVEEAFSRERMTAEVAALYHRLLATRAAARALG